MGLLALKKNPGYGLAGSAIGKLNISALKRLIPNKIIKKTIKFTKEAIDWSKTSAYSSPVTQQGIYVNLSGREPQGVIASGDYERVRDEIIDALHALKDPKTDTPIVQARRREEIFSGASIECIPDIILDFELSGLEAKDSVLGGEAVQWSDGGSRGIHHRDGVFIAHGPDVRAGSFDGLRLEDIAPNVLALAGLDVPRGLDGKLRDDIFKIKVKEVAG
ncbi:MAG TPA: hypothetical protein ENI11_02070 [Actinobacteria bacterium]|nr:hypothetical protein [Actinomycetota bacterium]